MRYYSLAIGAVFILASARTLAENDEVAKVRRHVVHRHKELMAANQSPGERQEVIERRRKQAAEEFNEELRFEFIELPKLKFFKTAHGSGVLHDSYYLLSEGGNVRDVAVNCGPFSNIYFSVFPSKGREFIAGFEKRRGTAELVSTWSFVYEANGKVEIVELPLFVFDNQAYRVTPLAFDVEALSVTFVTQSTGSTFAIVLNAPIKEQKESLVRSGVASADVLLKDPFADNGD